MFDIALVFSAHEWVESLHRHCTNTGILRIRSLVYDSAVLSSESFDACVISDTHPTLNKNLVIKIHQQNKLIFGVCDNSENSLEFLSSVGVDGIFSSRDSAENLAERILEFLSKRNVAFTSNQSDLDILSTLDSFEQSNQQHKIDADRINRICVIGSGGTGATEVSIALASRLVDCILVDLDFESPSIGPRAGLMVEPNLITAIEEANNLGPDKQLSIQRLPANAAIVGVSHSSFATDIRKHEITALIETLGNQYTNIVMDLGSISENSRFWKLQHQVLIGVDSVVLVGDPTPVGILRILESLVIIDSILKTLKDPTKVHVVVNKIAKNFPQRQDIVQELETFPQIDSIHFFNYTKDLYAHSWKAQTKSPRIWKSKVEELIFALEPQIIKEELINDRTEVEDRIQQTKPKVAI